MSKSRKGRVEEPRPTSAVDRGMLASYGRAARVPTPREQVRALMRLVDEYGACAREGAHVLAMGVSLELIDVALAIAVTPSLDQGDWQYKSGFFEDLFPDMAQTMHHPHAARVALAALTAERALRGRAGDARH